VVSGAAGAVGITVCEIAKIKGCRVIGVAGSDEKNKYLIEQVKVDAAINYKTENVSESLKEACPEGVDIYFDNVGGDVSNAVLPLLRTGARIPLCGQISMYNLDKPAVGLKPEPFLLINRAFMKGFIITDYGARFGEAIQQLARWLAEGKLTHPETITEGFDNIPKAFIGLFRGENLGKQIVKVG
jgi:NADPH-dependent curcumin reductase CurA